jgi:hypothetical protein
MAAVRLRMRGEIKLPRWLPLSAEQVVLWDLGMIRIATVWMPGMPIWEAIALLAAMAPYSRPVRPHPPCRFPIP